ncbi:phosphoadenosine phosphosulfate reductase family protein [Cohnella sp. GCM10020058]|uniref:phosphoadenosine phosphosulfate reductase domain-containing protein n=1 Tax=Cohnella sp. GCM10020058 TaxID=3317330 RepID=UPI003632B67B
MVNRILFWGGGKAGLAVADWVKENHPDDNILLYFTDTCWESPDLYRFTDEAADKLKLPLLVHSQGITPVQLMFEKKLVFNSMIGDCSKILKMRTAADFLKRGKRPAIERWRNAEYLRDQDFTKDAVLYFGIGFDEMHREGPIRKNWQPFTVEMPLIDHNIYKDAPLKKYNIKQPILYDYGFSHNNCNGRCVKAGQGHYKLLKEQMPDVFEKIMEQEYHLMICVSAYRYITNDKVPEEDRIPEYVREPMLQELDDAYRDYFYDRAPKPKFYVHPAGSASKEYMHIQRYSFMKRGGEPYNIRDLHYEVENDDQIDMFDIGGCGCFVEGLDSA